MTSSETRFIDGPDWRYRLLRPICQLVVFLLTRLQIRGAEHFPMTGPVIIVANHLHWLDPVIAMVVTPRPGYLFVAEKWAERPVVSHILRASGRAIFIVRGEADRQAIRQGLEALKAGAVLGVAPEGTRSKTGALQEGHAGAAFLASRTGAVIQPMVITGQEKSMAAWKRLRRPLVICQIGEPFTLPGSPNRAKGEQLEAYTADIMHRVAELLPPEYRGIYS